MRLRCRASTAVATATEATLRSPSPMLFVPLASGVAARAYFAWIGKRPTAGQINSGVFAQLVSPGESVSIIWFARFVPHCVQLVVSCLELATTTKVLLGKRAPTALLAAAGNW